MPMETGRASSGQRPARGRRRAGCRRGGSARPRRARARGAGWSRPRPATAAAAGRRRTDWRSRARTANAAPKKSSTVSSRPTTPSDARDAVPAARSAAGRRRRGRCGTPRASPAAPTRNAHDADQPEPHPAAPPRRQGVPVGEHVRDEHQPQEQEDPRARGELVRDHPGPARARARLEASRAPKQTPCATSSQPMRALVRAEHQQADRDADGGDGQGDDRVHAAILRPFHAGGQAPGNCSRTARDIWIVRPGRPGGRGSVHPGTTGPTDEGSAPCRSRGSRSSLPWSGAVAGLCWVGQDALQQMYTKDAPGAARADMVRDHLALNYGSVACLVVMGIALLFFATAVAQPAPLGRGPRSDVLQRRVRRLDRGGGRPLADGDVELGPDQRRRRRPRTTQALQTLSYVGLLRLGRDGHRPGHRLHRHGSRRPAQCRAAAGGSRS